MKTRFFLLTFCLLFLSGCVLWEKPTAFLNQPIINQVSEEEKSVNLSQTVRLLDGTTVLLGEEKKKPVAVILENLPGVPRPSLSSVSIIYEAPVEGGFTRFLAIFDLNNLPEKLGPIRSARTYFADLAEEYKPLFIHAGGSPEFLFKLRQEFYRFEDLNEISGQGKYFWRSQEPKPHNLYLKKESLEKFFTEQKIDGQANFFPWSFIDQLKSDNKVMTIKIIFSPFYQIAWQYDLEKNNYQYQQNNRIYQDAENQEIRVNNLVVQYTEIKIVDEEGRRKIRTDGQGEAKIFQKGRVVESKWRKEDGRTRFYNLEGQEINFVPGKTWIGIVSEKMTISYY